MKIVVLIHQEHKPPETVDESQVDWDKVDWMTEYDVVKYTQEAGFDVDVVSVGEDLIQMRKDIEAASPRVVFNLLEEWAGITASDSHVVSFLELLGYAYTGCNPRGLMLARDKALSKKILAYHRIPSAKFLVYPTNRPRFSVRTLDRKYIVKSLREDASFGIAQASIVSDAEKLKERVEFMHSQGVSAIAEEFIEGREFYVGVLGNYRLSAFPPFELVYDHVDEPEKEIYSRHAKFDHGYRERKGITSREADLPEELKGRLMREAKRTYRALGLSGYARIDFRVTAEEKIYVLEANPNPDISEVEDFADSARIAGISYPDLMRRIINLGDQWTPGAMPIQPRNPE